MSEVVQLANHPSRRYAETRSAPLGQPLPIGHERLVNATEQLGTLANQWRAAAEQLQENLQRLNNLGLSTLHERLIALGPDLDEMSKRRQETREVLRVIESGDIDACIALRDALRAHCAHFS
jgi:hypothetical protein